MNLSSLVLFVSETSGLQVTAYYSAFKLSWSLYWKSPKALLNAKFPSTLESSTWWPAFSILANSPALSGLWSSLKPMTPLVPLDKTPLESPALEQ
jgi:hypothetical protein